MFHRLTLLLLAAASPAALHAQDWTDASQRARATVDQMRPEERTALTHGLMAVPFLGMSVPDGAVPGSGYIKGVARLGIPDLTETDASLGVAYNGGVRKDGATALPSGMAMGSTWNPALIEQGGAMIGGEAHAKGFNVMLAGGSNLIREPRGGRTFEYLSEDPLLTGLLAGASIRGIQSRHVISTMKHYALNAQETGRGFVDSRISEPAARESDLLAFQIALEQGHPGSVMCSYNRINGDYACGNDRMLNGILKRDFGFPGFVMSDWGAVHGLDYALKGLDQQSGAQLDKAIYFAEPLAREDRQGGAYHDRVTDMNRRVLTAIYGVGVDRDPARKAPIDFDANGKVAEDVAKQGIVLLRNTGVLPLVAKANRIAVIGGHADAGVLSGGGSSQTQGEGGPVLSIPQGAGVLASLMAENYQRSSPLDALKARAPNARFTFRSSRYVAEAVTAAKQADVVILFATQFTTEGFDQPDLSLPDGQDAVIEAVAAANPNTIVVLENGGPVKMPWLERTAAVVEAWYPGIRGGQAIASVLFGDTNPSGRLPVTFPVSEAQLPHPELPGGATIEPDFLGLPKAGETLSVDYDVEGADVGYRWFARTKAKPLFPFGFGLSYTRFTHGPLTLQKRGQRLSASFSIRNAGDRAGADVGQVYLTDAAGTATQRLVGFEKVSLKPGESRTVTIDLDPRLLAQSVGNGWQIKGGTYRFAVGRSAGELEQSAALALDARRWDNGQAPGRR